MCGLLYFFDRVSSVDHRRQWHIGRSNRPLSSDRSRIPTTRRANVCEVSSALFHLDFLSTSEPNFIHPFDHANPLRRETNPSAHAYMYELAEDSIWMYLRACISLFLSRERDYATLSYLLTTYSRGVHWYVSTVLRAVAPDSTERTNDWRMTRKLVILLSREPRPSPTICALMVPR